MADFADTYDGPSLMLRWGITPENRLYHVGCHAELNLDLDERFEMQATIRNQRRSRVRECSQWNPSHSNTRAMRERLENIYSLPFDPDEPERGGD